MNVNKTLHIDMAELGMACSVPATVSQIKGTQKLVSASIAEVGFGVKSVTSRPLRSSKMSPSWYRLCTSKLDCLIT